MTAPTPNLNIPYVIINDDENRHAALSLGKLEVKLQDGTITDSERVHLHTLINAILDYQVSKAAIEAAR